MKHLKSAVSITVIFLLFFTGCGGGGGSSTPPFTPTPPPTQGVSLSITTQTVKAYVGEPKTISVTAQNTDFTVSATPSGSGCVKSGNNVVCTPTASGNYTVTVTATADTTKKVSATVTVPEMEIIAGDGQTLYADDTASATITFNAAGNWTATASEGSGGVPAWLSLGVVRGLSADDSTFEFYDDDSFPQSYDGDDYSEAEAISISAVNINGTAGNNDITVTLQPNDGFDEDDFTFEFYDDDSFLQSYDDGDYGEAEVSINAVSINGTAGNNTITVTLQPNDSMVDRTATITISTSSGQTRLTITQRYLKRDGTPYTTPNVSISISPVTVNTNVGVSKTFVVTRVNTADFTLSAPSAAGCVKSGANTVVCTPTAAGMYTVTVTATADTTKSASATLDSNVSISISPTSASTTVGTPITFTVAMVNTPDFTVSVPGTSTSNNGLARCVKSGVDAVVCTPTDARTYTVIVTATADTTKSASATMTVTSVPTPELTLSPSSITFPAAVVGYGTQTAQSVTIKNTGTLALTGVSASMTAGSANFEITSSPSASISEGDSSTITIRPRTGLSAGTYSGTLTVSTANGGNKTVSLSFRVLTTLAFDISQSSITFPSATVGYGTQTAQSVRIYNIKESGPLTGISASITAGSANFEITKTPSASIIPVNTTSVDLRPKTGLSVGTYSGTLTISTTDGGSKTVPLSFTVNAAEPILSISQSSITFTAATAGYDTQPQQSVTISNTGTVALTGVSASITAGSANFNITAQPSASISAGNSSSISIRPVTGLSAGTYSGTLTVSTANGGSKTVSLSFTVNAAAPILTITQSSITFSSATVGYSTQTAQSVTIRNTGTSALTGVSASIIPAGCSYFTITSFPATSISAGGSSTVGVRPSTGLSAGDYSCTLTVSTSNGGSNTVSLSFTVTVAPIWTLSHSSMTLPSAPIGYAVQTCQLVTISNTGTVALTSVSVSITAGSANFERCLSPSTTISAGNSSTVGVRPITGRSAGTYSGTLTVSTSNGGSKTVSLSFTVYPDYEIRTAADLNNIRNNLSGSYKLMADISLSSYANWEPIGSSAAPFTGTINGNGYKITGLKISRNTEDYIGLFGYIRNGATTNLVLESVDIQGRSYVGSVAGYIQYGTISGGSSTGLITSYVISSYSNPYYSGGIVGYMEGGAITGASSTASVTSSVTSSSGNRLYYSGGIAGYVNGGKITGSHSTGNISSVLPYTAYSGGIAGYVANGGEIRDSSSTGSVISNSSSNDAFSGGIAGYAGGSEISDSFSTGNISASAYYRAYSGGITGVATNISLINSSFSTGNISASFVPSAAPALSDNFYARSGGITGSANGGEITDSYSTGRISSSAPTGGILTPSYAISGGIAGQATNVRITRSFSMSVAGSISSSAGSGGYSPGFSYAYSGGIAGYVNSGRITDCYSSRDITTSSSDMYGDTYSGGIAGYATGNIITNCYSSGNISSSNSSSYADVYSGGIAGYAQNSQINNSAAITSAISAKTGAGRIAGGINTGNSAAISNNFALSTMIAAGSAPLNTGSSYHGVSKTDTELKTQSTYSNAVNGDGMGGLDWKFGDGNPWKMSGGGYPIFFWQ